MSMPDGIDEATRKRSFNEQLHRILRQYERLLNKGEDPGDALNKCFEQPEDISDVGREITDFMPRESESFSLVSVVERIIERVGNDARERENAFLQAFQDVVIDFSSRTSGTLLSFLRWWDRTSGKLSIASPEGVDAVNVMTIHKSKGLEFGCVIIPYGNWEIGKLDSTLWFSHKEVMESKALGKIDEALIPPLLPVKCSKELAYTDINGPFNEQLKQTKSDCLNKTYVAFTRAVDELHIFTEDMMGKAETDTLTKRLSYYLCKFCEKHDNEADGNLAADVATRVTPVTVEHPEEGYTETYYEVGAAGMKSYDEKASVKQPEHMPAYHVVNRHDLAKFKLPDVLYTPEREKGILYHKILSMVRSTRDLDRVLRHCTVRYILPSDSTQRDRIIADIRAMLSQSEEAASWFAPGNRVYNERPILDGKNRPRPDRVITTPDGRTIVIDYKFGEPHHTSHSRQVKGYMTLLSQAGFKNVEGRIWYPFDHRIVAVQ